MRQRVGGLAWMAALAACVLALSACNRPKQYSQETPDDVLRSAVEMIRDGQTQRLPDLIYADNEQMRRMLDQLGRLFGNMQKLAAATQQRFPDEMAKMKAEAERRAASGAQNPLLAQLAGGGGGRRGPPRGGDEDAMRDLVNRLFADPYGWLEQNAERLSTEMITDDQATILLDGQPLIPLIGLPMIERDGKWYVALPTNMPPLNQGWPRSKQQWDILRSVVIIADKAVIEMTEDVKQGRVATLDRLANKAQEKMLFPGAMAFAAYGRELDVRQRTDRRMSQWRTRQRDWARGRAEQAGGPVSPKLLNAMERVAAVELEAVVRKNERLAIDQLSPMQFEDLATEWLGRNGLAVRVDGAVDAASVDARVDAWLAAGGTDRPRK
ncbi:MAG: hypothetical protein KF699_00960 [Phycisphaeraceae bacterium]|nr:hypothetical protein [Phycisphaeraceae bacterium]